MKWWEPSSALGLQPLHHHQTPARLLLQYLEVPLPSLTPALALSMPDRNGEERFVFGVLIYHVYYSVNHYLPNAVAVKGLGTGLFFFFKH